MIYDQVSARYEYMHLPDLKKDLALKLKLYEKGIGCCAISAITLSELAYGVEKSSKAEQN